MITKIIIINWARLAVPHSECSVVEFCVPWGLRCVGEEIVLYSEIH